MILPTVRQRHRLRRLRRTSVIAVAVDDLRLQRVRIAADSTSVSSKLVAAPLAAARLDRTTTWLPGAIPRGTPTRKQLGALEIMINNAGILDGYFDVDEMTEAVWRRVIDTVTLPSLLCTVDSASGVHDGVLPGDGPATARLHNGEARDRRAHPPDGRRLRGARHHRERHLSGSYRDGAAEELAWRFSVRESRI